MAIIWRESSNKGTLETLDDFFYFAKASRPREKTSAARSIVRFCDAADQAFGNRNEKAKEAALDALDALGLALNRCGTRFVFDWSTGFATFENSALENADAYLGAFRDDAFSFLEMRAKESFSV